MTELEKLMADPSKAPIQEAYEAYAEKVGWTAHTGRSMPQWHDLPTQIQDAWSAALGAGIDAMMTNHDPVDMVELVIEDLRAVREGEDIPSAKPFEAPDVAELNYRALLHEVIDARRLLYFYHRERFAGSARESLFT
jgi:hypothetical protein